MKILFCSSEVFPFAKTGGLADVCGSLPLALEELGQEIVVVMPRYKGLVTPNKVTKVGDHLAKTVMGRNIPVYLVGHEHYFKRDGLYGTEEGDYQDNLARFQYFSERALQIPTLTGQDFDIVHCHDWQTALVPFYLKFLFTDDPIYRRMKSILTIHNLAYQGVFPKKNFPQLKLADRFFSPDFLEFYDRINLLKGGIVASEAVTTVSPTYAEEIQGKVLGCGLDGVLRSRGDRVMGILNGLDYSVWDPETDPLVSHNYPPDVANQKRHNKETLQRACGLSLDANIPVFGFVGRLSYQKGVDLIAQSAREWLKLPIQVVILGVGDEKYQRMLTDIAAGHPKKVSVALEFNEPLGHQIYAGSDFFWMPSIYEPCGLSQLISLKYGTIPIVSHTGGLADTISPYSAGGNGFVFTDYSPPAFLAEIQKALDLYQNRKKFFALAEKNCSYNFSWEESAKKYVTLYEDVLSKR